MIIKTGLTVNVPKLIYGIQSKYNIPFDCDLVKGVSTYDLDNENIAPYIACITTAILEEVKDMSILDDAYTFVTRLIYLASKPYMELV